MEILLFTSAREAIRFLRKHGNRVLQITVVVDIEKSQSLGGLKKNYDIVVVKGLFMWVPSRSSAHGEHTSRGQASRGRRGGSRGS